jgi:hypothetical protein
MLTEWCYAPMPTSLRREIASAKPALAYVATKWAPQPQP